MKVTILGCGTAGGVPLVGNKWGACDPNEPRNRRLRTSILIEEGDATFLVDTSPDLRQQLLACGLQDLSAVFYTHVHADHAHGIDDLRSVNWLTQKPIPIFSNASVLQELIGRFPYVFPKVEPAAATFYRPVLEPRPIEEPFDYSGVHISTFVQDHGNCLSYGYRFNDFGYSTDVKNLNDAAFDVLRGVKVWVVDAVREAPHPTHSHLEQTLEWIDRVKPERAYLTHMGHTMDYAGLKARLPSNIEPCYDGQVIEV